MKIIRRRRRRWWLWSLVLFLIVGIYLVWAVWRPLAPITPTPVDAELQATAVGTSLAWPANGQAAVGITGSDILNTNGVQSAVPTASTAKLITALAILKQKPLTLGQQGPILTLGSEDVALYNAYKSKDGSVVPAANGEQISEYQMLQAIMLPSANNMADSLAIWAFGSLDAYRAYATNYVSKLGLRDTRIGSDASGFAPDTVSSAHDLVILGENAIQNPVLAQIVGQATASGLPIVNNIKNVNFLLGTNNIIGIKTGNTDEAGGVFVGASRASVNGKPVVVVTAVTGSQSLFTAMKDSLALTRSAQANFQPASPTQGNTILASYKVSWARRAPAVATQNLTATSWAGTPLTANIHMQPLKLPAKAGQTVGSVTLQKTPFTDAKSVPIKLQNDLPKPPLRWRLTHPL